MTGTPRDARILIVDDDQGMLRAVSRVLERHFTVKTAAHPREAMEIARGFEPEVAVVDLRMPEMDGFELMDRLQGDTPGMDVILMTGNVEDPDQNLVRAIDEGAFYFIQKPFDRRVLLTLVGRCLELRRLRRAELRHAARMQRELEEARRFQLSILPPAERDMYGIKLSARYIACTELAGDLYDYAPIDDGRVAVLIADVSGHGASAAMMTGIVKSAFRSAHVNDYQPQSVVERISDSMRSFDPSRFITLFCGLIDTGAGTLTWSSAGHPPALLRRPGEPPARLESTGPLISSGFRSIPWGQETISLADATGVFLYTDGVIEVQSAEGLFGRARLEALIEQGAPSGPAMIDRVLSAVDTFTGGRPADDDMTLVAVEL